MGRTITTVSLSYISTAISRVWVSSSYYVSVRRDTGIKSTEQARIDVKLLSLSHAPHHFFVLFCYDFNFPSLLMRSILNSICYKFMKLFNFWSFHLRVPIFQIKIYHNMYQISFWCFSGTKFFLNIILEIVLCGKMGITCYPFV